jgi:hypothetical protein
MNPSRNRFIEYLLASSLGAFIGGAVVLITTNALPKMMSKMMSGMMTSGKSI